jgi:hypothetical protein
MDDRELADLAAFVHARLDQVDAATRLARQDGGDCWELVALERGDGAIWDEHGACVLQYDVDPATGMPVDHHANPLGARQAAFIALADPRIVREWMETMRGLLALLEGIAGYERALLLCAEPFRAHPDCRREWRPGL